MFDFPSSRKSVFFWPLTLAVVSMGLFLLALINSWMGMAEGVGAGFCEAGHPGLVKQPVNTWSNLGFIAAGLTIGWSQAHGRYAGFVNPMTSGKFFSTFYACLAVLLGPGSMAMHATTTRVGGFLDMLSMYMIASFIFAYALSRLLNLRELGFTLSFFTGLGIQLYVHTLPYDVPFVGFIGSFAFGVFLILSSVIEFINIGYRKLSNEMRWGVASILVMCLAFFIWNLSLSDSPWCDPSSLIQGHGIWHLLNALAIYCLYRYYVSEHKTV